MTEQEPIMLDVTKTRELLAAAVADRGADYVYQPPGYDASDPDMCFYWHVEDAETYYETHATRGDTGQPGCLVGHVLHAAGVPGAWLTDHEFTGVQGVLDQASRDGLLTCDTDARRLLAAAQSAQDGRSPWGEAIQSAERGLALYRND